MRIVYHERHITATVREWIKATEDAISELPEWLDALREIQLEGAGRYEMWALQSAIVRTFDQAAPPKEAPVVVTEAPGGMDWPHT